MLDTTQLLWTQIAAAVCMLIFAGLAYNLARLRGKLEASKAWISTTGEIIASEVKLPLSHVSDDQDDAVVVLRYHYSVGSRSYESDRIKMGGQTSMTRMLADTLVAKYPSGAHVDVYYDPQSPDNVVLEPNRRDNFVVQSILTVVLAVIAVILTAHAIVGKVLYTDNGVPLFAFVLPIGALLIAVSSLVAFVKGRQQARASAQWPTAAGTITTSTIIEESIEDRNDDEKNIVRVTLRYRVDLRFAYRVGQRDFVGTTWMWGWTPIYGRRDLAEKVVSKYTQGKPVTVYYDPARPGNAVLEPNNRQGSLAPLVLAGLFAVIGGVLLTFFINIGFDHK